LEKKSLLDKIKAQFKTTIPEDYDLEFDICMKCGRRLGDKKYSTLKKHQKDSHQIERKLKAREIFFKYPLTSLVIIALLVAIFLIIVPIGFVIDQILLALGFEVKEKIDVEKCTNELILFKQDLYESKSFGNEHVGEFDRLLKECNVNMLVFTTDDPLFEQDIYKRP